MKDQPEHSSSADQPRDAQRGAMLAWMEEVAPYGIFTTDEQLRIRTWNQWLVAHSGLTAEVLIGQPLITAFPTIVTRRLDQHFQRALAGQSSVLSTALHGFLLPLPTTARGYSVPQMLQTARIAPLSFEGRVVGTIATIEDVTQRECQSLSLHRQQEFDALLSLALGLLLEAEHPAEAAAELFPQLTGTMNVDACFSYVLSPGSDELQLLAASGVPPELRKTMARLPTGKALCSQPAVSRRPMIVPRLQSQPEHAADVLRRIGLRCFAGFPLLVGNRLLGTLSFGSYQRDEIAPEELELLSTIAKYLSTAIDRAFREQALQQARQTLAEHAETLETKIAERTARLHETIAQLESFSYTVAHDLRAPIRSLKGFSEILLEEFADALPEEAAAILQRLRRATIRLDALTQDLLKFSGISRDNVQLTAVDVDEVVHEIVGITPGLQGGVLRIEGTIGSVWAQRTMLQQCLSNLFDNALKFARPGVPLRLRVRGEIAHEPATSTPTADLPGFSAGSAAPGVFVVAALRPTTIAGTAPEGPRIRIWVEDNGIGIPPEAHERIFGIFERVSGMAHVEGTGIGLAIVARAIRRMGGACGVISTVGEGSRFWLELTGAPAA